MKNIAECFEKYFTYPTITKVDTNHVNLSVAGILLKTIFESVILTKRFIFNLGFPKLVACLNTQVSLRKIKQYYPEKHTLFEEMILNSPSEDV